ncbi:MAG TPA: hypothetical protein VKD67_08095 [Acidimicrobiales bacterium]|nr:hypothetical protein [Acidimicrobiales bacterium]
MRVRSAARYLPAAVVVAVALVVLSPALRASPRDGFPLSNYPMFATDVGRVARVDTAVGLRADGSTARLSPHLVTGTDEVILAASTVTNAVAAGPARTAGLCAEIATRVAASRTDVVQIRVATETYDAVDYFDGNTAPTAVEVHATCPVP